jgi:hypothetical protein
MKRHILCAAIVIFTRHAVAQDAPSQPATVSPLVIVGADFKFADEPATCSCDTVCSQPLSGRILRRHICWTKGSCVSHATLVQLQQSFPTDYMDDDQTYVLESQELSSPRQDLLVEQTPVAAEPKTCEDQCPTLARAEVVPADDDVVVLSDGPLPQGSSCTRPSCTR